MKNLLLTFTVIITLTLVLGVSPRLASAQQESQPTDYALLQPLPLTNPTGGPDNTTQASKYITGMVQLIIAVAGALAVVRIIIGGFMYMTTDAFGAKSEAKSTITNALIGFMLAISSFLILHTINPNLTTLNFSLENVGSTTALPTDLGSVGSPTDNATNLDRVKNCGSTDNPCDYTTPAYNGGWGPIPGGYDLSTIKSILDYKSCLAFAPYDCQISSKYPNFLTQLLGANTHINEDGLKWQITEAWPPSYKQHIDTCHQPGQEAGTCVDAALRSDTTPANIAKFMKDIKAAGFNSFWYEIACPSDAAQSVCDQKVASIQAIVGSGYKIVPNSNATGDHVHINAQ